MIDHQQAPTSGIQASCASQKPYILGAVHLNIEERWLEIVFPFSLLPTMPMLTTTIEDTSPIIVYSGQGGSDWRAGTSRDDPSLDLYSRGSYMVTNVLHATVSFSFYGTGVQLLGAKRQNHSFYQISIDTITYPQVNGLDEKGTFQTPLFNTVALANGNHNVTMQNLGTELLDIDFITWQTPVGGDNANEALISSTYQDSDSSFDYNPVAAWNAGPLNIGTFSGGSGHVTSTAGASVEFTFKLDSSAPANFSTNKPSARPQTLLYYAANLGRGEHSLVVRSEAWNNSAQTLGIDFAEVFTTAALDGGSSGLSTGAIVGITIGTIFGLLLLLILGILCLRKTRFGTTYIFCLRGRTGSRRGSRSLMTEALNYRPLGYVDSGTHQPLLHTQPSFGSLGSANSATWATAGTLAEPAPATTFSSPPTSGLPQSADMYTIMGSVDASALGPNTQVITIPFTADGKYRPDLAQATPQLMAPPQGPGLRRAASSGVPQVLQPRSPQPIGQTRSNMELGGLPPGAGQPALPNVSEESADIYVRGQEEQRRALSPPALTPLRRPPTIASPPEYRDRSPGR
ncbi:unnamed protein product [Cyclocybe aegerita]|uniref:Uncharacterized protein n=1 Tax=Cyclocybe aegerita TaxID=1973307 RepID=A0A8S0VXD4_CYCAE|nr:unnamed protein product [Cyclocybe aegerita]